MEKLSAPRTRIIDLRGRRVILDSDLAELYEVPTKQLNQQGRRNPERFPSDFAFPLSPSEWGSLKSQLATSSWGGRRGVPYAFTEYGALMAAGVLNSRRAIEMSIFVVRTFVAMRDALADTHELGSKLKDLEKAVESRLTKQDKAIADILAAIKALMHPHPGKRRPIGFIQPPEEP
jgi:hypothetical protein